MTDAGTASAGLWVGEAFVYNNSAWRLNYCVGGEVSTMFHLDRPLYLLGYLASQSKVYLIDKVPPPAVPCPGLLNMHAVPASEQPPRSLQWLPAQHTSPPWCQWLRHGPASQRLGTLGCWRHSRPAEDLHMMQEFGIVGYTMNLSMIEYKTLIIREELEAAAALLPSIPKVIDCWLALQTLPLLQARTARAPACVTLLVKEAHHMHPVSAS